MCGRLLYHFVFLSSPLASAISLFGGTSKKLKKHIWKKTPEGTAGSHILNETQIKFAWTIFIVCGFYFVCAGAMTYARFMRFFKRDSPFVVFITSTAFLIQFGVNFFVYFYRSEAYRKAYWDIIVLIFPCIEMNENVKKLLGLEMIEMTNL